MGKEMNISRINGFERKNIDPFMATPPIKKIYAVSAVSIVALMVITSVALVVITSVWLLSRIKWKITFVQRQKNPIENPTENERCDPFTSDMITMFKKNNLEFNSKIFRSLLIDHPERFCRDSLIEMIEKNNRKVAIVETPSSCALFFISNQKHHVLWYDSDDRKFFFGNFTNLRWENGASMNQRSNEEESCIYFQDKMKLFKDVVSAQPYSPKAYRLGPQESSGKSCLVYSHP
ncbi:MAG: hypothetical protein ChlgKO_06250 [Chlamydiales bacterium]